jgi:hypothetical protein
MRAQEYHASRDFQGRQRKIKSLETPFFIGSRAFASDRARPRSSGHFAAIAMPPTLKNSAKTVLSCVFKPRALC